MWSSKGDRLQRLIADSRGFETHAESPEAPDGESPGSSILWSQVGAVKRITTRPRTTVSRRTSTETQILRRELVFFDRAGNELLRVEDALDPPDRYKLFLESIPRWTGLRISEETRH